MKETNNTQRQRWGVGRVMGVLLYISGQKRSLGKARQGSFWFMKQTACVSETGKTGIFEGLKEGNQCSSNVLSQNSGPT